MDRAVATSLHARRRLTVLACTALLLALPTAGEARKKKRFRTPTRSSTIRITKNDKLVVAVNREANSLAVLQVRKGERDTFSLLAQVPVGIDPRFVAVDPAGKLAFVSNGASAPLGNACTTPWRASSKGSCLPGISSEKNSVTNTVSSPSSLSRSLVTAIAVG